MAGFLWKTGDRVFVGFSRRFPIKRRVRADSYRNLMRIELSGSGVKTGATRGSRLAYSPLRNAPFVQCSSLDPKPETLPTSGFRVGGSQGLRDKYSSRMNLSYGRIAFRPLRLCLSGSLSTRIHLKQCTGILKKRFPGNCSP